MRHVIQILLSELVLTCHYLLKLSVDIERDFEAEQRKQKKDLQKRRRIQMQMVEQQEGVEKGTHSYVHPLKKYAIDVHRWCHHFFT